jgi:hypothetical protein
MTTLERHDRQKLVPISFETSLVALFGIGIPAVRCEQQIAVEAILFVFRSISEKEEASSKISAPSLCLALQRYLSRARYDLGARTHSLHGYRMVAGLYARKIPQGYLTIRVETASGNRPIKGPALRRSPSADFDRLPRYDHRLVGRAS